MRGGGGFRCSGNQGTLFSFMHTAQQSNGGWVILCEGPSVIFDGQRRHCKRCEVCVRIMPLHQPRSKTRAAVASPTLDTCYTKSNQICDRKIYPQKAR